MPESKRDVLRRILIEEFGARERELNDNARLYHHLGIHRGHVDKLIDRLRQTFGVSFRDFDAEQFFPDAREALCYRTGSMSPQHFHRKPLTFSHLLKVVEAGEWFEPDESKRDAARRLLIEIFGVRERELHDDARIFHDLGIHGGDADELLEMIHKEFGTKLHGLDAETFFPADGEGGWGYRFAARINPHIRKKPLTFGHLVKVIEVGHWIEPEGDKVWR